MRKRVISIECDVEGCFDPGVVYLNSKHKGLMAVCLKCAGVESVTEWMQEKILAARKMNNNKRSKYGME